MKILCYLASIIIIIWMLVFVLLMFLTTKYPDTQWYTKTSPITNTCYEFYAIATYGGVSLTMSAIDDIYCTKETK